MLHPSGTCDKMAGAAVKKATETLVKATQEASVSVEDDSSGAKVSKYIKIASGHMYNSLY